MSTNASLDLETLDPVLADVIRNHREKVVGWMLGQPGCWGFLAGKAVVAWRQREGRPLADAERRLVWHRLWWWLEQIKEQVSQ
jgi:hypothetical protein